MAVLVNEQTSAIRQGFTGPQGTVLALVEGVIRRSGVNGIFGFNPTDAVQHVVKVGQ